MRRSTVIYAALLAICVWVVESWWRRSPYPSDQMNYLAAAERFPAAEVTGPASGADGLILDHQVLRIGLTIPIRLAMSVFGYSQATYLVVPMLAGVALALAVYAIGVLVFGRIVGLAAGALTVGTSVLFLDLTAPLPDLPATALFTCAVALAVAVREKSSVVAGPRRRLATLLLIGGLLGWSYLTREYIVFVWPLIPLLLWRRVGVRGLLWAALPVALIGLGETLFNAVVWGDPLARLHASAGHGGTLADQWYGQIYAGHSRQWYLTRLLADLGALPEGAWWKAALVVLVVGGVVWWRQQLWIFVVWAALFFVPLVLLGGVLDPEQPMLRLIKLRYWYPLVPAVVLGAVGVIWLLARKLLARRLPKGGLVAGVLVIGLAAVPLGIAQGARAVDPAYGATHFEQYRSWLVENGDRVDRVFAEPRTAYLLPLFDRGAFGGDRRWDGSVVRWEDRSPRTGDVVVVYDRPTASREASICTQCRSSLRAVLGPDFAIPPVWHRLFVTRDGVLEIYRVGPERPERAESNPERTR